MRSLAGIFLGLCCGAIISGALGATPDEPVDARLRMVYQKLRFSQQYPQEIAREIQVKLQGAQRPLEVIAELLKSPAGEMRLLCALLLTEYADPAGASLLWGLTRDPLESVRLTAAGGLTRMARIATVPIDPAGLQDERAAVRRLTASTLGALGDKGAEEALLQALPDESELVRVDIIKALRACGTARSVRSFVEALRDPSVLVRDNAARALGGFTDPVVVDPLLQALADPDWHVRASSAMSLGGWVKKSPKVREALLRVLEGDEFALVRDRAADSLSIAVDDERVVIALVRALGAGQRDVRFHAAQALITAKATHALPLLHQERRSENHHVREKVMEIFGRIGSKAEIPALIEGTADAEPAVKLAAINSLRALLDRGTGQELHARLSDRDPHVRAAASRALGDLGDKSATPLILPLLRDDNSFVRGAAAEALGKFGDRSAIAPLIKILTGENAETGEIPGLVIGTKDQFNASLALTDLQQRTRAIEALGTLRTTDAVEPIIKHGLRAEDAGLRAAAAYSLGQIRDPRALGPLQDTVRPYYDIVRNDPDMFILDPGTKVPDEDRRLKEKESRVRASVAWALGQIGDPTAVETLKKALHDQNSLVRDAAIEALAKIRERQEEPSDVPKAPSPAGTPASLKR